MKQLQYKSGNNTTLFAIGVLSIAIAIFVASPLFSQVSTSSPFSFSATAFAFGGDAGGDGGGGGDVGGGCCGGGGYEPPPNDDDRDDDPPTRTPRPRPAPTCTLSANPDAIDEGGSSTLSWNTSNATSVSINQGIGAVGARGNRSVSPAADTTYTLTATGAGGRVTCADTITVTSVQPDAPTCDAFTATPAALPVSGGQVTLSWQTSNADAVSINQSIGSVAVDGSQSATVSADTTYTLTATGNGQSTTCSASVDVENGGGGPTLSCSFEASPSSLNAGETSRLSWSTDNATDVSIDQGIGAVAGDGSVEVVVSGDITYTLTARDGTDEVQCTSFINTTSTGGGGGGGGGGSSRPRCELTADKTSVSPGEAVVLSWDNSRTNDMTLEDSRGTMLIDTERGDDFDEDEGSFTVRPTRNTTYTLTAIRGIRDDECTVAIVTDDITVASVRTQPPLTATISLADIPHTGFEAGPLMTGMFYTLLALWGLFVAYVLVVQRGSVFGVSLGIRRPQAAAAPMTSPEPAADVALFPVEALPVETVAGAPAVGYEAYNRQPAPRPLDESMVFQAGDVPHSASSSSPEAQLISLENHAHTARVLISSDALRYLIETEHTLEAQKALLDRVITRAKETYPSENGWVVVNRARIDELAIAPLAPAPAPVPAPASQEVPHDIPVAPAHAPAPLPTATGASSLAEAIVSGNLHAVNRLVGTNPLLSLADAASDLDALYRLRKGEKGAVVSDLLAEKGREVPEAQLEAAVAALTSVLDGTYEDDASAAKVALMKAVKAVKGAGA